MSASRIDAPRAGHRGRAEQPSRTAGASSAPGSTPPASAAGSPRWTTRGSACATSSPPWSSSSLGGIEALAMRVQLARPENRFLGPDLYNQVFTTHGSTMMFLFAVPIMLGLATYLVPLMVGTRNLAFPRLNAFSYYVYLIGGLFLYTAFFLNTGPGRRLVRLRAALRPAVQPGQAGGRLGADDHLHRDLVAGRGGQPDHHHLQAAGAGDVAQPHPALRLGDAGDLVHGGLRHAGGDAVEPDAGPRPAGRHPLLQPGAGGRRAALAAPVLVLRPSGGLHHLHPGDAGSCRRSSPPFTRREVFGYLALVLSLVATGFIGFGLWVHHMFATGLPQLGASFFTAASIMIAIPSGIQIFCWIATLWGGQLRFRTPLLYVLGFFFTFVIGGLTGVMLAAVPLDLQVHDTFFVVAHFHYVLIGGAVFPLLGGLFYWFPKMTGRMLSETWGKVSLLAGLPRLQAHLLPAAHPGARRDAAPGLHLPAGDGLGGLNLLSTSAPFVLGLGVLVYVAQRAASACAPASPPATTPGGRTPWSGRPPRRRRPTTSSTCRRSAARSPLWTAGASDHAGGDRPAQRPPGVPDHRPARRRAGPPRRCSPGPTLWPFVPARSASASPSSSASSPPGGCRSARCRAPSRWSPGSGRGGTRASRSSRRSVSSADVTAAAERRRRLRSCRPRRRLRPRARTARRSGGGSSAS